MVSSFFASFFASFFPSLQIKAYIRQSTNVIAEVMLTYFDNHYPIKGLNFSCFHGNAAFLCSNPQKQSLFLEHRQTRQKNDLRDRIANKQGYQMIYSHPYFTKSADH